MVVTLAEAVKGACLAMAAALEAAVNNHLVAREALAEWVVANPEVATVGEVTGMVAKVVDAAEAEAMATREVAAAVEGVG